MAEDDDVQYARNNNKMFLDEGSFYAQFLFNPEISDDADYSHIDKNLAVTRLASRWKEPERARSILRALHILNNRKYFSEQVVDEPTQDIQTVTVYMYKCPTCGTIQYSDYEYNNVKCCDNMLQPESMNRDVPVTIRKLKKLSMYPRTYHNLKAMFYAFTTTSMARDGHLMRSANTTNISKSESVEDRTKVKSSPFFGGKNKEYDRY